MLVEMKLQTDVPSRLSEGPLVNVAIFEGIGTKFEDIVEQSTNGNPWKDLEERIQC